MGIQWLSNVRWILVKDGYINDGWLMVTYGYLMFYTSLQTFVGIQPSLDMWDIFFTGNIYYEWSMMVGWLIPSPVHKHPAWWHLKTYLGHFWTLDVFDIGGWDMMGLCPDFCVISSALENPTFFFNVFFRFSHSSSILFFGFSFVGAPQQKHGLQKPIPSGYD